MRRTLLVILFLVLVCAVGNLVVAIIATNETEAPSRTLLMLEDSDAAAAGWPASPPVPWPPVTQRCELGHFAYRRCIASSWPEPPPDARELTVTHQMDLEEFGWPLSVLDRISLRWPWDDPRWSTTAPFDSGLRIRWSGLTLNSILEALVIWLVVFGGIRLWIAGQRR